MSRNNSARKWFSYIVLLGWSIFTLFPFYWMILTSFKDRISTYHYPPGYIPFLQFTPSSIGWSDIFQGYLSPSLFSRYTNSLIVGLGSAVLALLLGAPAAYALARFKFRRPMKNDGIAFWILSFRMFPQAAVVVPFLFMFTFFGLLDSQVALILADTVAALPFVVWILREFIIDLPVELEEAARMDGASRGGIVRHIVLPLIRPGLVVALILAFIFSWNELFFSVVLTFTKAQTMPALLVSQFSNFDNLWWDASALSILFMMPPLILSILIQKYIARGLTFGAVKG